MFTILFVSSVSVLVLLFPFPGIITLSVNVTQSVISYEELLHAFSCVCLFELVVGFLAILSFTSESV